MSKMLLVKPDYYNYPLGLSFVASTLERAGFDFDFVDASFPETDWKSKLASGNYSILASGGLVSDFFFLKQLFTTAKQIRPDVTTIAGGHIVKDVSPKILFDKLMVDFAVQGEAEITLPLLLESVIHKNDKYKNLNGVIYKDILGSVTANKKEKRIDLCKHRVQPSFNFIDHYKWVATRGTIPIITGKGCTGCCSFCSPSFRKFMARRFDDIFNNIDVVVNTYKAPNVAFVNEIIFEDEATIIDFCRQYKKMFDVPFSACLRLDVSPSVITHLKDAGCYGLNIGIESGSDKVLKIMNKQISVKQSKDFVEEALKHNMIIESGFMFNNEGEEESDIASTMALHMSLPISSRLCFTVPYSGTRIFKKALKTGRILDEFKFIEVCETLFKHYFHTDILFNKNSFGKSLLPNLTNVPDKEWIQLLQNAYLQFVSKFKLKDISFFAQDDEIFLSGKCPVCNANIQVQHDIYMPYIRDLRCPNYPHSCYNHIHFYAHIYDIPQLKEHAETVANKVCNAQRVIFCGDDFTSKFILDHNVFRFDFEAVKGVVSFYPSMLGTYLYSDNFGNFSENTKFLSVTEALEINPDFIIITDLSPVSVVIERFLISAGFSRDKIVYAIPPGTLPIPVKRNRWVPCPTPHPDSVVAVWDFNDTVSQLLRQNVLNSGKIVNTITHYDSVKADIRALESLEFDTLVVAAPSNLRYMKDICDSQHLSAKTLLFSEVYQNKYYLLHAYGGYGVSQLNQPHKSEIAGISASSF